MAREDIILVLRVRAQLGDAIRRLDRLEKEMRDVGGGASGAGHGSAGMGSAPHFYGRKRDLELRTRLASATQPFLPAPPLVQSRSVRSAPSAGLPDAARRRGEARFAVRVRRPTIRRMSSSCSGRTPRNGRTGMSPRGTGPPREVVPKAPLDALNWCAAA